MNKMKRLGRTLAELFGHDVITYSKGSIWRKMSRLVTLITVKAKVFSSCSPIVMLLSCYNLF